MGKLAFISESTVRSIVTRELAFDAVREVLDLSLIKVFTRSETRTCWEAATQKGLIGFIEL
jgi:hypothetical protein